MTEHRYRMDIEQWGPHKWYGNIVHQWRGYDRLSNRFFRDWSLGSEYQFGWTARSRERLERKLRRVIERERKRDEFLDGAVREEIVA